ncbi:cyclase family protein [Baekduia soli]|uniref:Cyclase family protein n=1 Tax=Baekduia soli TaxID=496014 RepID=A0A5B8U998_9ACTN|nr:cyclase family protein [Baekduia soli]QEC49716.1 cyclase family protein [Baekduia soli]
MQDLSAIDLTTTTFVDLTQPLFSGMPGSKVHGRAEVWTEHPFPAGYPDGCHIAVTHIKLAVHLGTHVDAPRHFIPDGKTVDEFDLERFVRPAVTIHLPRQGSVPVTADELAPHMDEVQPGDFVFLYFGYAERFLDEDFHEHPYLTLDAAQYLLQRGVSGLGVDTVTPDMPAQHRPPDFDFPVHKTLLGVDVLIFENLGPGLAQIAGTRRLVVAAPLPLAGDGALVTPFAVVPAPA